MHYEVEVLTLNGWQVLCWREGEPYEYDTEIGAAEDTGSIDPSRIVAVDDDGERSVVPG